MLPLPHVLRVLVFVCAVFTAQLCFAQTTGDYQSAVATGNWNVATNWNTWNGTAWVTAGAAPNSTNGVITIQATHTITITASVSVDQVIVNGTLNTSAAVVLTVANGAGVDLTINGTFGDASSASVVFTGTWVMGATGTLIKTTASASNAWQSGYDAGIANIPATSNWIVRRTATAQPPLSTTAPASGSVYPNLTIENNTANGWICPAGSSFSGNTAFATIKGNLDIGGSGTNVVDFISTNTNASPILVMGNVTIRSGSSFRNYGTGLEVRGDLTVNGVLCYDNTDNRRIIFSGTNNQTVSGTGSLFAYNVIVNKASGTVTLNRPIIVDNSCTFTSGVVNTTSTNLLTFGASATASGASNSSYVDGPVRYLGTAAFVFPTGEAGGYQPIAIAAFSPTAASFYAENFNNGCTSGCNLTTYPGWTITNTGTNDASASAFFVSCAENGNAVGACGSGCAGDATLHVANVSTSPAAAFFCPSGDCGAAYDAGLGGNAVRTSKRAESPTINCTGYSDLVFSFKYMEGGQNINDNASCWYFDGSSWTMLADIQKTVLCSGQGTWTAFSVPLPSSANNNPNVKVGFQWVNNDDGAGADPSFAVDNLRIAPGDYFTAEYFHSDPQVPYGSLLVPTLTTLSSCEYWILNRAGSSTVQTSVTLNFDANSCPVTAMADLRVARYDGISTWQDEGNTGTTGTTAAGSVTSVVVTSFSPFTLAEYTTPLPVVLTAFDAWYSDGNSQLLWRTSSEINNDFFTIERAGPDGVFIPIGRTDGHGTTSQPNEYHFTDTDPYAVVNYYRLKQVDYNGQFEYSPVRIVNTEQQSAFDVVSVLTGNGQIDLSVVAQEGQTVQTQITDVSGRVVYSSTLVIHHQPTHFVTSQLTPGVYFIETTDGQKRIVRKIQLLNE